MLRVSHGFIVYPGCKTTVTPVLGVVTPMLAFLKTELGFPRVQEKHRC